MQRRHLHKKRGRGVDAPGHPTNTEVPVPVVSNLLDLGDVAERVDIGVEVLA